MPGAFRNPGPVRYNGNMMNLTHEQKRQLNSYSIYTGEPAHPLFTLKSLKSDPESALRLVRAVSGADNPAVAASYFSRRIGMFTAMQLYTLIVYEEVWEGPDDAIRFGAIEEYGKLSVSTFLSAGGYVMADEADRTETIRKILRTYTKEVSDALRTVSSASSLTHWENLFGFLLYHLHVLLSDPWTAEEAEAVMEILKDDRTWVGLAQGSLFAKYLRGSRPSLLLNTTVRTTCCHSKDVPGLMQCGYCPLKR
ncbi:Ferric iron reductase protein FhuF, involved in iron transport [Bhargavaea ginsengi]|uniref:Ferric iron reductase protein FhuF, involved in iron transport n=2 Tax=Bhargavaea ginsengi TaxID=426757 RepID=A0A1H6VCR2_9BACL|nr:Ferric iron reductase protein FhuF, involved in iron transport [Bhargavaea ginsengi]